MVLLCYLLVLAVRNEASIHNASAIHYGNYSFTTDTIFEGLGEYALGVWMLGAVVYVLDEVSVPYAHLLGLPLSVRWPVGRIFDVAWAVSLAFLACLLLYQTSIWTTLDWAAAELAFPQNQSASSLAAFTGDNASSSSSSQSFSAQLEEQPMWFQQVLIDACPLWFALACAAVVLGAVLGVPCCSSRRFFWVTLLRVVGALFVTATFADGLFGDVLTSYNKAANHVARLLTTSLAVNWTTCNANFGIDPQITGSLLVQDASFGPTSAISSSSSNNNNNNNNNRGVGSYSGAKWPDLGGATTTTYSADIIHMGSLDVDFGEPSSTDVYTALLLGVPLLLRLVQNLQAFRVTSKPWPALGNALKYAVSLVVVVITVFHQVSGNLEMQQPFLAMCVCKTTDASLPVA
jgi:hypothetical protein